MRQIPLYILTILVGLCLAYVFIAPFKGGLPGPVVGGQEVTIAPENFEVPDDTDGTNSDAVPAPDEKTNPAPASPQARQVDPDGFVFSKQPAAPLQRIEPRQPLSEIGHASPPAPPPPPVPVDTTARPKLLYRPVATAAGSIEASGYRVSLDGIDIIPPEQTCAVENGASWPCGMAARTAFRNWLRTRAVECNVPDQPPEGVISTQCKLGTIDLAAWLVENGWARAHDGTPMADSMKKAEEAKLGIFGSPPAMLPALGDTPSLDSSDNVPDLFSEPAAPPASVPDTGFPPKPQ
ncbi:thermonuclease family protein [Phyllobacterium sp. 628]|uniref:thermonuclease family protein n=1 Tax=Phyllobacterium sp. 628 TaxID=2718938 RepID=UPI0016624B5C|nr:thermonuclease family protein [Phyllobacterium sp. 628]QND51852.1 thermonuclease family protein [Phyllobacterium sp. 628]